MREKASSNDESKGDVFTTHDGFFQDVSTADVLASRSVASVRPKHTRVYVIWKSVFQRGQRRK